MYFSYKVELVLVPKTVLNRRDRGRKLEQMKNEFMEQLPTREQIFESFLINQRWKNYKTKLISEILAKKNVCNHTTFADVPKIVRDENQHYYDDQLTLHLPPLL